MATTVVVRTVGELRKALENFPAEISIFVNMGRDLSVGFVGGEIHLQIELIGVEAPKEGVKE